VVVGGTGGSYPLIISPHLSNFIPRRVTFEATSCVSKLKQHRGVSVNASMPVFTNTLDLRLTEQHAF
jgi:hypothetical protein